MGVIMDIKQVGQHCKTKADSTLNNMKKEDLIRYIRMLEHNYNVAVDFNIQQVKNFNKMEDNIVKELDERAVSIPTDSDPQRYFRVIGVKTAMDIVRRGGVSRGSK